MGWDSDTSLLSCKAVSPHHMPGSARGRRADAPLLILGVPLVQLGRLLGRRQRGYWECPYWRPRAGIRLQELGACVA
jgi:hypothetical protein